MDTHQIQEGFQEEAPGGSLKNPRDSIIGPVTAFQPPELCYPCGVRVIEKADRGVGLRFVLMIIAFTF